MNGTISKPNRWYYQQMWRRTDSNDAANAGHLRTDLYHLGLYPTGDLSPDPGQRTGHANKRAALHQITEELNTTDLTALFNVARLLLLFPHDSTLFPYIAAHQAQSLRDLGLNVPRNEA